MRTSFIVLIALVFATFAAAQRLEINGDNYSTGHSQQTFIQDIAQNWLEQKVGITWEDITSHLGLLVAGLLHFFLEDFGFGAFKGESMIPMMIEQAFGKNYIEQATNSPFRFQGF